MNSKIIKEEGEEDAKFPCLMKLHNQSTVVIATGFDYDSANQLIIKAIVICSRYKAEIGASFLYTKGQLMPFKGKVQLES